MNGTFVGMKEIENELILCTQTYNDTVDFRSFGNTVINKCEIDLSIFSRTRNYPTYFYQLYLRKQDSDDFEDIPIPIIIENYFGNNKMDIFLSLEQKKLFKRFFMIYSTFENNRERIIFAQNITFNVTLRDVYGESRMYIPYLQIYYDSADTVGENNKKIFTFVSNYTMDITKIINWSLAILIICVVLTVFIVAARMYVWCILNPQQLSEGNYASYFILTLVFKIFKYFGIIIFFYSWGLSAFWYIFYKMQYRPYVFLPSFYEAYKVHYEKFNIVWGLACTMYGCYIMFRIYEQVNSDVFFVDWEHEKDILENVMGKTSNKLYKSPWRSIHVVNQYNLLQKSRTISIPFCLCWLVMLYYSKYTKWTDYTDVSPNYSHVEKSPENIILRHFIGTFILFISGIAQYVLVRLVQIWIPTKKTEFLDLCSVANISVLILQDSLRGYYIHGQSPLGVADTTLQQLIQFLEEEGKGKIKGRGITDEKNDNLQTYEIYLSFSMRKIYDGLYFLPTIQEIDKGNQYDQIQKQAKFRNFFKYIPDSLKSANIYQINKFMNNHLKTKIEQVTMQSKVLIKDKTLRERFFKFPPSIDLTSENIRELVFYRDPGENFDDVLFIGMELEWLINVIYFWQMWCISLERYRYSFPISVFMTYVMEQIFFRIRVFFGEKNVAKKAVVDNRFL